MFELPEILTLTMQMNKTLKGKIIQLGQLGNSPHKFVWYNRTHEEFAALTKGKRIGEARTQGRWLSLAIEPGYVIVIGECGGKLQYHPAGEPLPKKYHLWLLFEDFSSMTIMTSLWGAMELYEAGAEQEREYIKDMRTTPIEPGFTFNYFSDLIDDLLAGPKRSVKSLLTQDQIIPGLGNAIAQDIMYRARLHPRRPLNELNAGHRRDLYQAIIDTVREVSDKGGRYDEFDLFGKQGGYIRLMDRSAVGRPCPECGHKIEKSQYLGGACYYCSHCQV